MICCYALLATGFPNEALLDLRFSKSLSTIFIGRPIDISVQVINRGTGTIALVRQSTTNYSRRSPNSLLEIRKAGSTKWIVVDEMPTCGNTNPIEINDFERLPPGASLTWHGRLAWQPELADQLTRNQGAYEIRFTLKTSAPIDDWIGGPIPEPMHSERVKLIREWYDLVPKGVFVTAPKLVSIYADAKSE